MVVSSFGGAWNRRIPAELYSANKLVTRFGNRGRQLSPLGRRRARASSVAQQLGKRVETAAMVALPCSSGLEILRRSFQLSVYASVGSMPMISISSPPKSGWSFSRMR
jgi:hypothetical protein